MIAEPPVQYEIRQLSNDVTPEHVTAVAQLLFWSGQEYFEKVFGGEGKGLDYLQRCVRGTKGEFAANRITAMLHERVPIAIVTGLRGSEIEAARKSDLLALMSVLNAQEKARALAELRTIHLDLPAVGADDLYIRSLAVHPDYRGKGLARRIMVAFIAWHVSRGERRFRLDVLAAKTAAVALYGSLGFEIVSRSTSAAREMLSMVLEVSK